MHSRGRSARGQASSRPVPGPQTCHDAQYASCQTKNFSIVSLVATMLLVVSTSKRSMACVHIHISNFNLETPPWFLLLLCTVDTCKPRGPLLHSVCATGDNNRCWTMHKGPAEICCKPDVLKDGFACMNEAHDESLRLEPAPYTKTNTPVFTWVQDFETNDTSAPDPRRWNICCSARAGGFSKGSFSDRLTVLRVVRRPPL